MNFQFRSRKCFRSIWKIHEELVWFELIFGFYVAWRFDWCMVWCILEKFWLMSAGASRGRRPELQLPCLSVYLGFVHCGLHVAPCVYEWLVLICLTLPRVCDWWCVRAKSFNEAVRFDVWMWVVDVISALHRVALVISDFYLNYFFSLHISHENSIILFTLEKS